MNEQQLCLTGITMCALVILRQRTAALAIIEKKKRRRILWARQWLLRRDYGRGMSNLVFKELKFEDPASFKNFCRMSSNIFDLLLHDVESLISRQDTYLRECIPARTRLLVTLRYLATGETFQSLSYSFRISVPSLSNIIPETVNAIYNVLKDEYLKTPMKKDEWLQIARFYKEWNFPNCLGALDGKHIAFRARKVDGSMYYNYKKFNSIILMALVDADYNFIYVDIGCNGRAGDAGVYNKSTLCMAVERNLLDFPEDATLPKSTEKAPYVILGDEAFRLSKRLMKPCGQRSSQEGKVFNYRLSRARRVVENAFGILANRFQILQKDINADVEKVQAITITCCALHNYIKQKDGKQFYLKGIDNENTTNLTLTKGDWRANVYMTDLERSLANRSADEPIKIREQFKKYFNTEGLVPWQWEAIKKFNF